MTRWDWIRGIMGLPGDAKNQLTGDEVLLAVREGFDAIASALQRFESEMSDKLDLARGEFKAYAKLVNEKIRDLEKRIEILEDILFEPDPSIKEQKLSAARQSIVSTNPFTKSRK